MITTTKSIRNFHESMLRVTVSETSATRGLLFGGRPQEASMSVLNAKFGQVIRDRRRQSELTQQQVAKRVGTSTPYVGHIEAGKRHTSDESVTRLAEERGFDRLELYF